MPSFDVERERIYIFAIEDTYYFKRYFERTDIFADLQKYYNNDEYRFEIPADDFPAVRAYLEDNYYDVIEVDSLTEFCVVKEQYSPHADILRNAVSHWTRRDYNFFLMKDPHAVAEAVERGASRLEDTDLVLGL